jgi:hypothetical protein
MEIEKSVRISPAEWPGKPLRIQPGNLELFAPGGLGLSGPFPFRPWDDPFGPSPQRFYGLQARTGHPLQDAPVSDAAGGIIYFDGTPDHDDVKALLRLLEVRTGEKEYAAFLGEATDPPEQRFVTQLRLVSRMALISMYGALAGDETFPAQELDLGGALWRFIECEQQRWGTGMGGALSGAMGGDGDWAKESLAFGFMVENSFQGVYRIWSRAWLVTK